MSIQSMQMDSGASVTFLKINIFVSISCTSSFSVSRYVYCQFTKCACIYVNMFFLVYIWSYTLPVIREGTAL